MHILLLNMKESTEKLKRKHKQKKENLIDGIMWMKFLMYISIMYNSFNVVPRIHIQAFYLWIKKFNVKNTKRIKKSQKKRKALAFLFYNNSSN